MTRIANMSGFSYVEVLVASVLIAIALVPALDAITAIAKHDDMHIQHAARQYQLEAKLEDVLGESYDTLQAEALVTGDQNTVSAAFSDTAGSQDRRLVYLSLYDGDDADSDGDGFTGTDQGLLWIRVAIENSSMELQSLVSASGIE